MTKTTYTVSHTVGLYIPYMVLLSVWLGGLLAVEGTNTGDTQVGGDAELDRHRPAELDRHLVGAGTELAAVAGF